MYRGGFLVTSGEVVCTTSTRLSVLVPGEDEAGPRDSDPTTDQGGGGFWRVAAVDITAQGGLQPFYHCHHVAGGVSGEVVVVDSNMRGFFW